jgi:hypothetical protein
MPQAVTTTFLVALLAFSPTTRAGGEAPAATGSLAQARRLIEAKDFTSATTMLEDLLIEADASEKPAITGLLKQTYEALARQAQDAGRDRDAAHYRDNIAILEGTGPTSDPAQPTRPAITPPAGPKPSRPGECSDVKAIPPKDPPSAGPRMRSPDPAPIALEPAPPSEPAKAAPTEPVRRRPGQPVGSNSTRSGTIGTTSPDSNLPSREVPARDAASATLQPEPASSITAQSAAVTQPDAAASSVAGPTCEQANRLWSAKKYSEAGRLYAALARENRLPVEHKDHWAYCRMRDVAQRINARPRSSGEWDEIEAEIHSIQQLAPKLWYGEYLRKFVADVRGGRKPQARTEHMIVRGSAPDESQAESPQQRRPRLFGKSRTEPPAAAETEIAPVPAGQAPVANGAERPATPAGATAEAESPIAQNASGIETGPTSPAGATTEKPAIDPELRRTKADPKSTTKSSWQVIETANFRVFHCDPGLAEQVAKVAENVRAAQAKRWGSLAAQRPWTPRCDLYLYPDGPTLAHATGQPETAPGFSDLLTDRGRVTTRRTVLRADYPQLLTAVLPHEITHVVLADLFTTQVIPRWADEGIAVLAEPDTEQNLRAADLRESLETGRIIDLAELMNGDQAAAKQWTVYYAQSVSLTRFLVEQDSPERFIQFVQRSNGKGIEPALREVYRIGGVADLQDRWLAYARQRLSNHEPDRRDVSSQPSTSDVQSNGSSSR